MTHARLCIGTSGWGYREWRGGFYPPSLASADFLAHYATRFAAVEANSTAYGLPTAVTVERWRAAVPARFTMACKAPHAITHRKRLRDCDGLMTNFLARVRPLGDRLGPLLFQLPPSLPADEGLLRAFLAMARSRAGSHPLACEFRHPSWYQETVFAILDDAAVACCVHDMPGSAWTVIRPAVPFLYMRRHGTAGRYAGAYGRAELMADADVVAGRLAAGHAAYVFFNNTMDGSALTDAVILHDLVRERHPPGAEAE